MTYRSRLKGDAFPLTTPGAAGMVTIKNLKQGVWLPDVFTKAILIINTGQSNTVYVGPRGQAQVPLPPGSGGNPGGFVILENVVPGDVGINDKGNQTTLAISYGGEPESCD